MTVDESERVPQIHQFENAVYAATRSGGSAQWTPTRYGPIDYTVVIEGDRESDPLHFAENDAETDALHCSQHTSTTMVHR